MIPTEAKLVLLETDIHKLLYKITEMRIKHDHLADRLQKLEEAQHAQENSTQSRKETRERRSQVQDKAQDRA